MASKKWREENVEKLRKYRKDWYNRNSKHAKDKIFARRRAIRAWFQGLKSDLECEVCGENHIACLEFHHTDPKQKDINLSAVINQGWSKERILREISKCKVYCSNCHRKFHFNEGAW